MTSNFPSNIDNVIGNKIKALRRKYKFTQAIIGKKIGVTSQQIQKYEKGSNKISASKLYDLSIELDTPISYFFNQSHNNTQNTSIKFEEETSEFKYEIEASEDNLMDAFKEIKNKKNKKKLLDFLKAVAKE